MERFARYIFFDMLVLCPDGLSGSLVESISGSNEVCADESPDKPDLVNPSGCHYVETLMRVSTFT